MKSYKSLLLVTAIVTIVVPFSLTAFNTSDEEFAKNLTKKIQETSACPAPETLQERGWVFGIRQSAGNLLRGFGDVLRKEGNPQIGAHRAVQIAKEVTEKSITAKIGLPSSIASKLWNPVGNFFRYVGEQIKGHATQTPTRMILDSLVDTKKVNYNSKEIDAAQAMKLAAFTTLKAGQQQDIYEGVVNGLVNRGYTAAKNIDAHKIYVDVVAEEAFDSPDMSLDAFSKAVRAKGFEALENMAHVKATRNIGKKLELMNKYLQESFEFLKARDSFNKARSAAPAA